MSEILDRVAKDYGLTTGEYLGACVGQVLTVAIYRKLGAPWWAALGLGTIQGNLYVINKREAARVRAEEA
jgi:predicted phosphoribosyltransferase